MHAPHGSSNHPNDLIRDGYVFAIYTSVYNMLASAVMAVRRTCYCIQTSTYVIYIHGYQGQMGVRCA
jgi:hypothetical protein